MVIKLRIRERPFHVKKTKCKYVSSFMFNFIKFVRGLSSCLTGWEALDAVNGARLSPKMNYTEIGRN